MSSADAVLFMLATSASRDLYRGFVKRDATEAELLRVARIAAIVGGVCGVGVACVWQRAGRCQRVLRDPDRDVVVPSSAVCMSEAPAARRAGINPGGVPVLIVTHYLTDGQVTVFLARSRVSSQARLRLEWHQKI